MPGGTAILHPAARHGAEGPPPHRPSKPADVQATAGDGPAAHRRGGDRSAEDRGPDRLGGGAGVAGGVEGGGAGDVRGGHRGAAEGTIGAVRGGGEDSV